MNRQRQTSSLRVSAPASVALRWKVALAAFLVTVSFVLPLALQGVRGHVGSPPKERVFSVAVTYVGLAALGIAFGVGLCLAAARRLWRDQTQGGRRAKAAWWERLLFVAIYTAIAAASVVAVGALHRSTGGRAAAAARHAGGRPLIPGHRTPAAAPAYDRWSVFAALALGALLGAALLVLLYRREHVQAARGGSARDALAGAVSAGVDELETEPDPRRAVIRCYAAMERSLGAWGFPRGTAETPFEYLSRLLGRREAGADAAAALTPLFERAKFSRRTIDEGMRREALEAIRSLGRELEQ